MPILYHALRGLQAWGGVSLRNFVVVSACQHSTYGAARRGEMQFRKHKGQKNSPANSREATKPSTTSVFKYKQGGCSPAPLSLGMRPHAAHALTACEYPPKGWGHDRGGIIHSFSPLGDALSLQSIYTRSDEFNLKRSQRCSGDSLWRRIGVSYGNSDSTLSLPC